MSRYSRGIGCTTSGSGVLEVLVFVLALVVALAGPALVPEDGAARGGGGEGVESLGAGNGSLVGRWGVSTAASASTARVGVVRRHLASAESVGERMGRDAGTFAGSEGTGGRGGTHGAVGVITNVPGEA